MDRSVKSGGHPRNTQSQIWGHVISCDGITKKGASVSITEAPIPVADIAQLTAADGIFTFEYLPPGHYRIEAYAGKRSGSTVVDLLPAMSVYTEIVFFDGM